MLRKLVNILVLLCLPAVFSGCGDDKVRAASETPRHKVRVARAQKVMLARTVGVTGTLAADEEVTLSMKVPGRVGELFVDLGSKVHRGQPLARLEPTDFELTVQQSQAAYEQARARLGLDAGSEETPPIDPQQTSTVRQASAVLEQSKLTQERMNSLFQDGLIAKSQLDDAVAAVRVAEARYDDALEEVQNRKAVLVQRQAELDIARKRQSDSTLVSPVDGAVQERMISRGQFLTAGDPAFRIVNSDPLRLRVSIPEREAVSIRPGLPVKVRIEGTDTEYPGKIARVSPAISSGNRTLAVEAEIPNKSGELRPGSFASADIVIQAEDPAILVPSDSITTFAGVDKVITVKDNVTVEKRVRTGRRSGNQVEIVEGVSQGDVVVISPGTLVGGETVDPAW